AGRFTSNPTPIKAYPRIKRSGEAMLCQFCPAGSVCDKRMKPAITRTAPIKRIRIARFANNGAGGAATGAGMFRWCFFFFLAMRSRFELFNLYAQRFCVFPVAFLPQRGFQRLERGEIVRRLRDLLLIKGNCRFCRSFYPLNLPLYE